MGIFDFIKKKKAPITGVIKSPPSSPTPTTPSSSTYIGGGIGIGGGGFQSMPPTAPSVQAGLIPSDVPKSGGGGSSYNEPTYNPSTGVYVNEQGQSFSTPTKPEGAKLVGGSPDIQRVRQQVEAVRRVRQEAQTRGENISTPVRERKFINTLRREEQVRSQLIPEEKKEYYRTVEVPEKPKGTFNFFEALKYDLSSTQSKYATKSARGNITPLGRVGYFGVGVGGALLDQFIGIKQLVINPLKTIKNIPSGIKTEVINLGGSLKSKSPEFALGRITGFYAGSKGIGYAGKGIVKVSDIVRTKGTLEVPMESVVAPEYIKGQTYPAIAKGQTAGELLKEFKPVREQYGVTSLKGFTASSKPFSKLTEAGAGSSEISGVYQAPKLSPQFLRITKGEQKVFSLNPLETLRPSASIIKPIAFELVSGVKPLQRNIAPLKPAKMFIETKGELGKSYVPFVKTEKEAIIPAGTPLVLKDKRFYFKFEGRRVPIYEFEIGDLTKISKKLYSTKDIIKSSSYKVGSKSKFSSADILKVSRSYSKVSYKPSYSVTPPLKSSVSYGISSKFYNILPSSNLKIPSYTSRTYNYNNYYLIGGGGSSSGGSSISGRGGIPTRSFSYKQYQVKHPKLPSGGFNVFVRRFGLFKSVGVARTQREAFQLGQYQTRTTLGATFKVEGFGVKQPQKIFGYKTKPTKQGIFYIEQPKYRLSTPTEKSEILSFRTRRKR